MLRERGDEDCVAEDGEPEPQRRRRAREGEPVALAREVAVEAVVDGDLLEARDGRGGEAIVIAFLQGHASMVLKRRT